ncbi:MAG TPA: PEGA domain-containing protein [Candidatus Dojkabacteria bacterium]|jgi:hypothetical protein
MKKILIIGSIILFLIIIGIWSPWLNWNISLSRIFGLDTKEEASGLQVFSLVGEIEVYLDNEFLGTTKPEDGTPLSYLEIKPGVHTIQLFRQSDPQGSYYLLSRDIVFEDGLEVIISYELGPTQEFSEGHIFYAEKSFSSRDKALLNTISTPDKSRLYIDNTFIGETPASSIELSLDKVHTIKLEKEGYDTIEFNILPESQEERDKLKGFTLNLEANMFLIPLEIEE